MAIESISGASMKLVMQLGIGLVAVVILVGLWLLSKYGSKWYKRGKTFKIGAVIFNPDGTFSIDKIGKFKTNDGIDKMLFLSSGESMPVIDPKFIRASQCCLFRYAPGQYAVIPPQLWERIDLKKFKIELINFQMKNFAFLEQRAAVSRWAYLKDILQKWAPYITVLLILVLGGVTIYFITKMAMGEFNSVTAARIAECAKLIGGGSSVAPPA